MKKITLRVVAVCLLLVVILLSFSACDKQKEKQFILPTEKFFVNDFAGVITDEDAAKIYADGVALQTDTTAQVVVVTVESLDGKPIFSVFSKVP